MIYKRNRILYAVMIIVVIFLGLSSRKMADNVPDFLNTYLGDGLWALMIYLGFSFIFNKMDIKKIALMGILFCYLIEISQLYHADWIDNIRNTTLGGLVLGYGFLWSDIMAYTLGIGVGIIIDALINYSKGNKKVIN